MYGNLDHLSLYVHLHGAYVIQVINNVYFYTYVLYLIVGCLLRKRNNNMSSLKKMVFHNC